MSMATAAPGLKPRWCSPSPAHQAKKRIRLGTEESKINLKGTSQ